METKEYSVDVSMKNGSKIKLQLTGKMFDDLLRLISDKHCTVVFVNHPKNQDTKGHVIMKSGISSIFFEEV